MSTDHTTHSADVQPHGTAALRAEARKARADLASTLDAIEYKLNLPKQLRLSARRLKHTLRQIGEDNPAALIGIALGSAAIAGGAVWLGVRAFLDKR